MTHETGTIDQNLLRKCLGLASSYLITDTSMNAERGLSTWICGLNNLVDVLVALHVRGELELGTMNEASKVCSECWMIAGTWRELDGSRVLVRGVASRLRTVGCRYLVLTASRCVDGSLAAVGREWEDISRREGLCAVVRGIGAGLGSVMNTHFIVFYLS
jgi:hypothetical protein